MADQNDDQSDFKLDTNPNTGNPRRTDKRGLLHMLHDELGKAIGVGRATDRKVNAGGGQMKGLMDVVDDAVKGAPAPGSED